MRGRSVATFLALGVAGCSLLYGPDADVSGGGDVVAPSDGGLDVLDAALDSRTEPVSEAGPDAPVLPAIPAAGLVVWLRADDGLVASADGRIAAWNDSAPKLRAGAPMNALQPMSSAQPLRTTGPGGLVTVTFDGDQVLELPFGFADFTAGLSLFVATVVSPMRKGGSVFALGLAGSGCGRAAELSVATEGFDYRVENGDLATTAPLSSSWEVLSAVHTPFPSGADAGNGCPESAAELRRSGLVVESGSVFIPAKGARSNTRVGRSNYYPDVWLRGSVGEIVLYDRALTVAETTTVSAYLMAKWPH